MSGRPCQMIISYKSRICFFLSERWPAKLRFGQIRGKEETSGCLGRYVGFERMTEK